MLARTIRHQFEMNFVLTVVFVFKLSFLDFSFFE